MTGPIKIVRETVTGGPNAWTGEWSLERPPRYPSPFLFRKSAAVIGAGVVIVLGSAPEADARRLDAGWNAVETSLHATGGA